MILQTFSVGWLALGFALTTLLLPEQFLLIGLVGMVLGISFAIQGLLRGRSKWVYLSMLDLWLLFFGMLISQAISETFEQRLPLLLLQFVVLLFAVEVLGATCRLKEQSSAESPERGQSVRGGGYVSAYAQRTTNHIARVGLLFASCYVVTLVILFIGGLLASTVPLLADISVYIVVVSVSLALLLVLQEE